MRLLFLAHRIPYPPNKGDKIRSFHHLMALTGRGHEVRLLAFADEPCDLAYQWELASMCTFAQIVPLDRRQAKLRALAGVFGRAPLSLRYFSSRTMRLAVVRELKRLTFDAVFVSSSAMAQYVPAEVSQRTVVDLVDVDSEKWRDYARHRRGPTAWVYQLEWRRLRRYEHAIVTHFAHTIVTTQLEATLLEPLAGSRNTPDRLHVLTNGVDLECYQPHARSQSMLPRPPTSEQGFLDGPMRPRLVFVGCMDYFPNADGVRYFVEAVLPTIRQYEPRTEFLIVGSNPPAGVRRLGKHAGVTVTGFVVDVRPYLAAATVCVVPLRVARGVQNKVLEAMACGRAIVATPEAVAGLRVVAGEHLMVARGRLELAAAVIELLHDEPLRQRLGAQARGFVEREHRWAPLQEQVVDLIETVAHKGDSRSMGHAFYAPLSAAGAAGGAWVP